LPVDSGKLTAAIARFIKASGTKSDAWITNAKVVRDHHHGRGDALRGPGHVRLTLNVPLVAAHVLFVPEADIGSFIR